MWSIRQAGTQWEVLNGAGEVVTTVDSYDAGLAYIAGQLQAVPAAQLAEDGGTSDGLLADVWEDVSGICFSEATGDGRDFTDCTWSARDPEVSLLPLMLQTQTEWGHFGAELAGFMSEVTGLGAGSTPRAAGRFYDSERGREARDILLDGRRFGVSVDPGAVTAEWECTEVDDEGWCVEETVRFTAYEVIGLTMTPFPAFAAAAIQLRSGAGAAAGDAESTDTEGGDGGAVAAAAPAQADTSLEAMRSIVASIPVRPPAEWFAMAEPASGDERLVEQPDGGLACPLTITDDGQVFGHAARWGQCHVGFPGQCVTPPESVAAYAHFHVGEVVTDNGERIATGVLTAGCDHAAVSLRASDARDHYAHSGVGWADVRVSNGELGPWVAGALRPDVTPEQLRVLRASSLSGDWRRLGGGLEMIGVLAVNVPGFPIARDALAASGLQIVPASPMPRGAVTDGVQVALVASGIVHRCTECARRDAEAAARRGAQNGSTDHALQQVLHQLGVLERRTRHLRTAERDRLAARIRG